MQWLKAAMIAALLLSPAAVMAMGQKKTEPTAADLPRWRGFNLINRYSPAWDDARRGFEEQEFKWIADWGFDFVRLPLDYHFFIEDDDWEKLSPGKMSEIDRVLEWAEKYGIHVMLNLHRAPGFCVNEPKEPLDLWTSEKAQQVCELHWRTWAKRLKKWPNSRLSFNLFNEPRAVDEATYKKVAARMLKAVREESPHRLVVLDGLNYASEPAMSLRELKVAQATRGYKPHELTHYAASWSGGSEEAPPPTWPPTSLNGYLYGDEKADLQKPLVLNVDIRDQATLRLKVDTVSQKADLTVLADGREIYRKRLQPGKGAGEWESSEYKSEWQIYQARYNRNYRVDIKGPVKKLEIAVAEGDWLTLHEIGLQLKGKQELVLPSSGREWGGDPGTAKINAQGQVSRDLATRAEAVAHLRETTLLPWLKLRASGTDFMVGEWGAHNKTPHDVVLAWMEDLLKMWKSEDVGWALWNLQGSFGVLNSGREDVDYEDFHGRKLDRKMLELLQKY